jgi:hypothetical protein
VTDNNRQVTLGLNYNNQGAQDTAGGGYIALRSLGLAQTSPISQDTFTLPELPPTVENYSYSSGFEDATVQFRVRGASALAGYPSTSKMTLILYEMKIVGGGTSNEYVSTVELPITDSTADYTTSFGDLSASTTYFFTISGYMNGESVLSPFYDASLERTGREYRFSTAQNLQIGGPSSTFTVAYRAPAYDNKYLEIAYTLSGPSRGFEIWYDVVKTTSSSGAIIPDGQQRKESFKEASTVFLTNGSSMNYGKIQISSQAAAGALAGFWEYGSTYTVSVRATSSGTSLGEAGAKPYTLPIPRQPQFIVTATPDTTAVAGSFDTYPVVFKITPSDLDATITYSRYIVRIMNSVQADVTPADISTAVYEFGQNTNRQQTVTAPDLQMANGYTMQIYAVDDRYYEGGPSYPAIEDVNAPDLGQYVVRSVQFDVLDANSLQIGDITVSPLEGVTQLIFENEQNLGTYAKFIKYSITKADGGELPISSEVLDFTIRTSGSGADAYEYYNLPTSISGTGLYLIELRFIGPDRVTVVGQKTVSFRKLS